MGAEPGRTIAFSVRLLSLIPLSAAGGLVAGVPIVPDTLQEAHFKIDVTLEDIRGGAFLLPLASDAKEMKGELSAKLVDTPPQIVGLTAAGTYSKVTVAGTAVPADGRTKI